MQLSVYLDPRGAKSALARALDVDPQLVGQWASGIRPVPAERCIEVEKATGGRVRCEDMRPDVDWAFLRKVDARRKAAQTSPLEASDA